MVKKRIAFFGGGVSNIPSYQAMINELSRYYLITVYFEFYNEITYPINYNVKIIPKAIEKFGKLKYIAFAFMIIKDMLLGKVDLIHSHSTYPSGLSAIILGNIFRIPVIVSLNAAEATALPAIKFGDLTIGWRKLINKLVIEKADEVIVLTNFQLDQIRNNLSITRKISVIPRGINTAKFFYKLQPIRVPVTIVNVAYLHPVKDQRSLLKAFSLILEKIECYLIHIGKDLQNGEIQRMAKQMGLENRVQFIGYVPNETLTDYYGNADILLHTSLYESQAIVINEAMASGVLVCGSHVGLLADLANECCLAVPPGAPEQLAKAVVELLADSERMQSLRKNAYQWAQSHDLEWTLNQHKEIYERLMSTGSPDPN